MCTKFGLAVYLLQLMQGLDHSVKLMRFMGHIT